MSVMEIFLLFLQRLTSRFSGCSKVVFFFFFFFFFHDFDIFDWLNEIVSKVSLFDFSKRLGYFAVSFTSSCL